MNCHRHLYEQNLAGRCWPFGKATPVYKTINCIGVGYTNTCSILRLISDLIKQPTMTTSDSNNVWFRWSVATGRERAVKLHSKQYSFQFYVELVGFERHVILNLYRRLDFNKAQRIQAVSRKMIRLILNWLRHKLTKTTLMNLEPLYTNISQK